MVALVMLVVISLMAVSAMRGALTADLVAGNARSQALAEQAAEVALRYCERQVQANATGFTIQAAPATAGTTNWNTFTKWFGSGTRVSVSPTAAILASTNSSFIASKAPECMAENAVLADGTAVILVTARGFSPDYSEDSSTGRATGGAVVWLQSTLFTN